MDAGYGDNGVGSTGVNARRGLGTNSNGVGRAFLGLGGVLGFVGGDGGDEVTCIAETVGDEADRGKGLRIE
jgi:hypothetical protein